MKSSIRQVRSLIYGNHHMEVFRMVAKIDISTGGAIVHAGSVMFRNVRKNKLRV